MTESPSTPYFARGVSVSDVLSDRIALVVAGFVCLIAATRILSGLLGRSKGTGNGARTVPMAPYWLPIIGHVPNFLLAPEPFFKWARLAYKQGIFSLNLGGTTHSFIFKPALGHIVMSQKNDVADSETAQRYMMNTVFGWPKKTLYKYDDAFVDIIACYKQLMSNPGLSKLIDGTVQEIKRNINNLATFSESPVDMMYWEHSAKPQVTTDVLGEQWQEVSLLSLLRDYVAKTANPALFGTDFMRMNEGCWADLWTFDYALFYLATGLQRWFPIPTLTRGHIARRRLMQALVPYEAALQKWHDGEDPGPEWAELDNISEVIKHRLDVYKKHDLTLEERAYYELTLMWAMNANANPLIFWVVSHVYADPTLLEQIREEIAPYVRVRVPHQHFAIREPPVLEAIDHEALATDCPLLKAAYIESLRVDTATWSFKIIRQDVTLAERGGKGGAGDSAPYVLQKGTYCHVAHELHHGDVAYYDEPDVWRVNRHLRYEPGQGGGPAVAKADMGTIRPYGGGHSMCKGRAFAMKEVLMFTAAIFSFWDMEPADGGPWVMPKTRKTAGTKGVQEDVRVKIKRRQFNKPAR